MTAPAPDRFQDSNGGGGMTAEERAYAVSGTLVGLMSDVHQQLRDYALEMIRAAVAAERERCAKVADEYAASIYRVPNGALEWATAIKLAARIRELE